MVTIVLVAYNRVNCLDRLFKRLLQCNYLGDKVKLIISIDNSGSDEVFNYSKNCEWPIGDFEIIQHQKKLGLREHILFCGSLTNIYENIIVLEDDLFVSLGFYNFAKQAILRYKDVDEIAGISLYKHEFNFLCNRPFLPLSEGYDVFFIQMAQSWGQVWTKNYWNSYISWYEANKNEELNAKNFPESIANWPSSSWLKYYNKYLVETKKFYVYPHTSLTTNFSEPGTHSKTSNNSFQVSLQTNDSVKYTFVDVINSFSVYDIFFENIRLNDKLCLSQNELEIDLYGNKQIEKRYLLTNRLNFNYKIIQSYALSLRPHELNIVYGIEGKDIILYDTTTLNNNNHIENYYNYINTFLYDTKIPINDIHLKTGIQRLKDKLIIYLQIIFK
jgi:hypothetical protein